MKLEDAKKESLIEVIKKQRTDIIRLREENAALYDTLDDYEAYRENTYILMSENFRYKRMMEILDEEKRALSEQLIKERKRLDKAERAMRNLQKWMDIKGYSGGW